MQKVIGLDIGSYSIKAVEIINTFKSYEISNFYENVIPHIDEVSPDALIPAAMEQLFKENNLEADRIITAMPGQFVSSRIMSFNFADPRKIETAVMSEVEDVVPFSLDDMIVDHQILGGMSGKTVALVVMTRKNFMKGFLEYLQRIKIDPKLIDVDSLAFYNLSAYMNLDPAQCSAMIDIGHEKTSICIVQGGVLRMFRSINLGGRYITEFLARDLEVSFNEAQRVKHRVSRVFCQEDEASELSGDDKLAVERMTLASNAIVKELGRTLYSFKNWEKSPVSRLLISGGTTRIKNFGRYLQEQLEVPVDEVRLDKTDIHIKADLSQNMAILPQSVAIGMRAVTSAKKHSTINLRRGEFAYVQDYEAVLKSSGAIFKVVAVAMALLLVSYGFKYFFYMQQIDALQEQFKKEYTAIFPKSKTNKNVNFVKMRKDAVAQITQEIKVKKEAIQGFISENSASGALTALKDISEKLPKEVKVDITLYEFKGEDGGGGKIVLKGETDKYASVAAIKESLEKISSLKEVEERQSGAKPGTDNKIIEFTINARYVAPVVGDGKA